MDKDVDNGNNQEKLFTQEEVNTIIRKRLERGAAKADPEQEERLKELDQREAELNRKAMQLDCRSYLTEQGYDVDLLDVISADNLDDFKSKADKLSAMITSKRNNYAAPLASYENHNVDPVEQAIKAAFSPENKHTPVDTFRPLPKE